MKVKTLVCKQCGYEQKIRTYSSEDAERGRFQLTSPRCERCGSSNVKLYD
jgi:ribosomal protein L37E